MADKALNIFRTSIKREKTPAPLRRSKSSATKRSEFRERPEPSKLPSKHHRPFIMSTVFKSSSHLAHATNYQTGVKGVLADAHSYESAKRRELLNCPRSLDSGYSIPEIADEDGLMNTWRKNRLAEIKAGVPTNRRHSPSKRNYGRVEPVDAAGYLDAIERVSRDTIVLVLIYDPRSPEGRFVEDCLVNLAKRYSTTRFVKLPYAEAEMDPEVAPAILAYKGGELIRSIPRIVDEIPVGRSLSSESLEWVLTRARVLMRD